MIPHIYTHQATLMAGHVVKRCYYRSEAAAREDMAQHIANLPAALQAEAWVEVKQRWEPVAVLLLLQLAKAYRSHRRAEHPPAGLPIPSPPQPCRASAPWYLRFPCAHRILRPILMYWGRTTRPMRRPGVTGRVEFRVPN